MLFHNLLLGLLLTAATASSQEPAAPDRVLQAQVDSDDREQARLNTYTLSIISLTSLHAAPASVETVTTHPDFMLTCHNGRDFTLLRAWQELPKIAASNTQGAQHDVRVVFTHQENIVAFTASGAAGYLNGQPVLFTNATQAWFKKHISPIAKALYIYPPQKK